jgi:hypothetical protein
MIHQVGPHLQWVYQHAPKSKNRWSYCLDFPKKITWFTVHGNELGKHVPSGNFWHSHGIDGTFIDGLPIKNGWIFHGYVKYPVGTCFLNQLKEPHEMSPSAQGVARPLHFYESTMKQLAGLSSLRVTYRTAICYGTNYRWYLTLLHACDVFAVTQNQLFACIWVTINLITFIVCIHMCIWLVHPIGSLIGIEKELCWQ